nr:substrate-binding domain-containing protein [Candidatus Freyarchaeota archaeon]
MSKKSIRVFAAGGVAPPIQKAGKQFQEKYGVEVDFTIGKAEKLISEIKENKIGDVLSCGAEYVLDNAEQLGIILKESRKSVGNRKSVILLQKGNPKKIQSLKDLAKDGIRIGISTSGCLVGVWDDVCSKAGLTDQIRKNITDFADGCGAVMALINQKKVDAIFGWNVFKNIWPGPSEMLEIPKEIQVQRSTGVATISYSKEVKLASKFIDFLTSKEVKGIYAEYGWIHNL